MTNTQSTRRTVRRYADTVRPGDVLTTRDGGAARKVAEVERFNGGGVRFRYVGGETDRFITPADRAVFTLPR